MWEYRSRGGRAEMSGGKGVLLSARHKLVSRSQTRQPVPCPARYLVWLMVASTTGTKWAIFFFAQEISRKQSRERR